MDGAIVSLSEARHAYVTANQESPAVNVATHIGGIVGRLGDFTTAKRLLSESLPVLDQGNGELWGAANTYASLGLIVAIEGDVVHGALLTEYACRLHAVLGDRLMTIITITNAAQILAMAGRAEAAMLLGATDMMREEAGPSVSNVVRPTYQLAIELTRAWLAAPDFDAAFDAGQRMDTEQVVATARAALAMITSEVTSPIPLADTLTCPLSPRERAVMQLVAAGHTDQEVATRLKLRARTVSAYVTSARRKLGATSRAAAAVEAVLRGLT